MTRPTPGGAGRDGGLHPARAAAVIVVVIVLGWWLLYKAHGPVPRPPTNAAGHTPTTLAPSHTGTTTVPGSTTTTTPLLPPSRVALQVLNGTGSGNLSSEWSAKLHASPGYSTLAPADATATVASSVIYVISPGFAAEGDALATTVGLTPAKVMTTVPATAPIPAVARTHSNLVLIIGPDLPSPGATTTTTTAGATG